MIVAQSQPSGSNAATPTLTSEDRNFIELTAKDGRTEVQIAKAAMNRARGASVKDFAQHLLDDGIKSKQQIENLGRREGLVIPPDPVEKESNSGEVIGQNFDHDFVQLMIQDHEREIARYEKELKETKDEDLKSFINSNLPTLRNHLTQAKQLSVSK